MEYIKLGNTGIDVSKICLGMMSFGKPDKEKGLSPGLEILKMLNPFSRKPSIGVLIILIRPINKTTHNMGGLVLFYPDKTCIFKSKKNIMKKCENHIDKISLLNYNELKSMNRGH